MLKQFFALSLILAVAGFGLTACNTVEGAAEDVGAGAGAVEDSARNNKNY